MNVVEVVILGVAAAAVVAETVAGTAILLFPQRYLI